MPPTGPGIVLVGMPGSGKSTVGRLVAERLGRPFVDTDALFQRLHHTPVPDYLRRHGEPAFREAEAAAVAQACATGGSVIGAGGGAVLDPLSRWTLWHHGLVAWLDVPPEALVSRLESDGVARPTLQPYDAGRLASVLAEREPFYRAADLRLDARRPPALVAEELVARGSQPRGRRLFDAEIPRRHPIGPATARTVMGVDLDLAELAPRGVAVVDRRLPGELVARLPARAALPVRAGERAKRLRRLEAILEWLAEQRVERGEPLLAVGGGTIGDLGGTAAALYARGVSLVQVPTTWLAQADSALGGKVALDLAAAKNAVGAFWPPVAVISDVAVLRSLPLRLRRDGMAESVKAALIGDPALWRLLEARGHAALRDDEAARFAIIERSARLKLRVCERDPFESGERRTLNLGHTIGHALEVESGYRLSHGSAVALGMRVVAAIGAARGAQAELGARLDELLAVLGFRLVRSFDEAAVRRATRTDKKRRHGRQRWIVPMEIGRVVEVDDVTDAELARALRTIAA
ncbi:MAG TPA: bifunctional shikimate kinase/3-dehydroquinate synthase, partial [Candidatus Limnocylindria bacterium]|nr:bifunctional shikimate kinase/3-dehydroquinate synthase [Candidatus Limnocylindria bacterium]